MRLLRRIPLFAYGVLAALLLGWLVFPSLLYRRIDQPLQFSHALHTSESVGLSCQDCHSIDEAGNFSGVPSVRSCANCHEDMLGESDSERRLVEDYVAKGREIDWLVYSRQPDNVRFSHAAHVMAANLECARCHGTHGSTDHLRPLEKNRVSGYPRDIWGHSISRFASAHSTGMKMGDCCDCHQRAGVKTACLDCHR